MRTSRHSNFKVASFVLISILLSPANSIGEGLESSEMEQLIKEAEAGDPVAQFNLAGAYDFGFYGVRDGERAMRFYLMAAEQGHVEAQNSVGSGLQAEGKYAEARVWYQRAVDSGHGLAMNNLAYLYDLGLGVEQDRQHAFELYSRAADLGRADAMWNIANMYGAGQIGEVDLFNACIWTVRSSTYLGKEEQNDELSTRLEMSVEFLKETLSKMKFQECQEAANSWEPSFRQEDSGQ